MFFGSFEAVGGAEVFLGKVKKPQKSHLTVAREGALSATLRLREAASRPRERS